MVFFGLSDQAKNEAGLRDKGSFILAKFVFVWGNRVKKIEQSVAKDCRQ
ncbi:MAG TPA: hypothetical protein VJ810_40175 [Blastocatellia bacterium]|nr:hypothetical protein [Blastocatellia bacterium]